MLASIRPGSGEARTSPISAPGSSEPRAVRTCASASAETAAGAGAALSAVGAAAGRSGGSAAQAARLVPRARERIRLRFIREILGDCGLGPRRGTEVRDSGTGPAAADRFRRAGDAVRAGA